MVNFILKPETPYRYELKYLEIQEIGTLQSAQGKGYGKEIIKAVKNIAQEHDILPYSHKTPTVALNNGNYIVIQNGKSKMQSMW